MSDLQDSFEQAARDVQTLPERPDNETLLRQVGDRVSRGDPVASVGSSGGQGQPALYFELRRGGRPIDPSGWLQKR